MSKMHEVYSWSSAGISGYSDEKGPTYEIFFAKNMIVKWDV